MATVGQGVEMVAGDSRTIRVTIYGEDMATLADLTSATARWWLARSPRSTGANVFLQKSTSGGITIDEEASVVSITLDPEDTEDLSAGVYYHELEIIDGGGNVATVASGSFVIRQALIPPA